MYICRKTYIAAFKIETCKAIFKTKQKNKKPEPTFNSDFTILDNSHRSFAVFCRYELCNKRNQTVPWNLNMKMETKILREHRAYIKEAFLH